MSDLRNIQSSPLRLDTSRLSEYLYADKPKLSFWQKVTRGFGKAISFLGPIGAAVTAIAVPGAGIPIAAGMYGLSKLASDRTAMAEAKDAQRMQDYNSQMAQTQASIPGFYDGMGQIALDPSFVAPPQFSQGIGQTIQNRESMIRTNITQM